MKSAINPVWERALLCARIFAMAPHQLGGVLVRAQPGPVRDRWLAELARHLPEGARPRRVPLHASDERLLGGVDLAATLKAGRAVVSRGLLSDVEGGVVVLAMAERMSAAAAARFTSVLDQGELLVERDGVSARQPAHFGIVAFDESLADDAGPAGALLDRLGLWLDLSTLSPRDCAASIIEPQTPRAQPDCLGEVRTNDGVIEALCKTASALGVASLRAVLQAVIVARAAAALAGRDETDESDAALAAQLVFAPRATRLPVESVADEKTDGEEDSSPPEESAVPEAAHSDQDGAGSDRQDEGGDAPGSPAPPLPDAQEALDDVVLDAGRAALPPQLLSRLTSGQGPRRGAMSGRSAALRQSAGRGRPAGTRAGVPGRAGRLNVMDTLRAAAPWQSLRRAQRSGEGAGARGVRRFELRSSDFRVTRLLERSQTTTVFVVDASGSAALHRLAEAKGAVELLLAECYVRRDRVAVLAFRGTGTELLLPATRSLARAKRSLAGLPGGGATPLAGAIDSGVALADTLRQRGDAPILVFLTDARANVARDGQKGRAVAEADALAAARHLRAAHLSALLVDTSPLPSDGARRLAEAMGATYLALPHADATALAAAARVAAR